MAEFRVVPGSLLVTPSKTSFASGEDVELRVKCQVQRKNGLGALVTWQSEYKFYDKNNTLLASQTMVHTMAPWTDIDTENVEFTKKIGTFSPGLLEGYVAISASG